MSRPDIVLVPCEACGTEGRIYVSAGYDRETGAPQERDEGPCPYCDGTGAELVPCEPVEEDDLLVTDGRVTRRGWAG